MTRGPAPVCLVPIVEGHSEARSIPAFLRRILNDTGAFHIDVTHAIREHRLRLIKKDVLVNRIRMAEYHDNCAGVVVILDADDDPACELGPQLRGFATEAGITTPCRIVVAVRELESWLMAGIESLRGYRGIHENATPPENLEGIRGAKEWLNARKDGGYKATIDQLPLLLRLDYATARSRAPSLDKFLRDMHALIQGAS
jgi:hypothetical protein